jgi:glycosidase
MKQRFRILLLSLIVSQIFAQQKTPVDQPPAWAKEVIWYQIFVERFNNGDPSNDPTPSNIVIPPMDLHAPTGWTVTPWTSNWWEQESWAKLPGKSFGEMLQYRRYGGDLQGVLNKLDYLQELGVTAIFLNPINDAPSLHKYDARYYHHVDVNFGPDPAGDNALIASEIPNDPTTWKWTSADKLFLKLVEEVHKRKMKIIMDYSWNHTGTTFWAWNDILKNQANSAFKDWYTIKSFDDPATAENEFSYEGWLNIPSLPEIKKVAITTEKKAGHPYEGNIADGPKAHIFEVTKRWLSPEGNLAKGVDGFRLDVADQIGLGFWREYRTHVRSLKPNAYLVGEIWWEEWPERLMNPVPYTRGDIFDAVMFYQVYRPARYFFAETNFSIEANEFKDSLLFQWNRLPKANRYAMMNVSSSHDTPRLLTDFYNPNKYKFNATPDDPAYRTNKPDWQAYARLKLYLVHVFTSIGAPHIWNGEEMGMWGADDPYPRKPLMWKEHSFQPETKDNFKNISSEFDKVEFNQPHFDFYRKLAAIRKANPVLISGELEFIKTEGKLLGYRRFDAKSEILVFFNVDSKSHSFNLPPKSVYSNLLSNTTGIKSTISLKPLEAVILKRK